MSDIDSTLNALRDAVRFAPDNIPLAEHFGKTLLNLLRYEEAEQHCKAMLARHPSALSLKLLMAETYYRQNKNSHALAIVETMTAHAEDCPGSLVLYAKLMYRAGNVPTAVASYKQAIELSDEVKDPEFAGLLGIGQWGEASDSSGMSDDDEVEGADEIIDGRIRQRSDSDSDAGETAPLERPTISFKDVGGMDKVKEQIQVKIIFPLAHAAMYAAYGKKIGGGILMYGPPGCGKTHLARATAGEVNSKFMSIGINDVLDMWMGNSERNLHSLFEQARRNRPCVLFFDEVDALGASRSDMRQSSGRHLVNQFLAEMDGTQSNNEGVLVLGATNAPWHVDSAFRRPGRFDQVLFVPPPDATARAETLKILLEGKPVENIDYGQVAAKTNEFSGADLKAVVDRAIESKLQEGIRTGKLSPMATKDLIATAKTVKPSTREWFATARNHALYANQGGIYDDILEYLKIK